MKIQKSASLLSSSRKFRFRHACSRITKLWIFPSVAMVVLPLRFPFHCLDLGHRALHSSWKIFHDNVTRLVVGAVNVGVLLRRPTVFCVNSWYLVSLSSLELIALSAASLFTACFTVPFKARQIRLSVLFIGSLEEILRRVFTVFWITLTANRMKVFSSYLSRTILSIFKSVECVKWNAFLSPKN